MRLHSLRTAAICAGLLFATMFTACGDDTECPVCTQDAVNCDQGATDVPAADTNISDTTDIGRDVAVDTEPGDADATDAADVETGAGRMAGRAYFTNHDDHSGFVVKAYHKNEQAEWQEGGVPPHATAISAKSGYYFFDHLPAGVYWLEISHGDFATDSFKRVNDIKVVDGETAQATETAMTAVGAVTGTLKFDAQDDWLANPLVFTEGHRRYTNEIGDSGEFKLTGLLAGTYKVCAGAFNAVGTCIDQVEVRPVEYTDLGEIEMTPLNTPPGAVATISGNVKMVGMDDSSGIQVIINQETDNLVTTTDAAGNYYFNDVPGGINQIEFSAPEGSGFEQGSAVVLYAMYAGTSDKVPARVLSRGQSIWRTGNHGLAAKNATFSPDGSMAVFMTDIYNAEYPGWDQSGLESVDLATGKATELARSVNYFKVSPDSRYAVYNSAGDNQLLFSVPLAGGKKVSLTTESSWAECSISPDSKYVLFLKQESPTDDISAMTTWASDIETGEERQICNGLLNRITSDSKYVVCWSRGDDLEIHELETGDPVYSASNPASFVMGADERTILVCGSDGLAEVFNLETTDSATVPDSIEDCNRAMLMPSVETVVYVSAQNYLKSFDVAAGTTVTLDSGDLYPLLATPDSTTIVYGASSTVPDHFNLLAVSLDGSTIPVTLAADLPGSADSLNDLNGDQYRYLRVTGDSSAIFLLTRQSTTSTKLQRIAINDGSVIEFGGVCWANCGSSDEPRWIMDEGRGYVYMLRPYGTSVVSADIATGETKFELADAIIGPVAPDLSGTAITLEPSDDLAWMKFPDLSVVSLAPEDEEYNVHTIGLTSGNMVISRDGGRIMFESDFIMTDEELEKSVDYRVMVAALK